MTEKHVIGVDMDAQRMSAMASKCWLSPEAPVAAGCRDTVASFWPAVLSGAESGIDVAGSA